jgi:hypothetical protein
MDMIFQGMSMSEVVVDPLVSRYRPQIFSEVFGQDIPVRILSELIKSGEISCFMAASGLARQRSLASTGWR